MQAMPEICAIVSCVGDARALAAAGVQRVYLDVIDLEPTDEVLGEAWAQGLVPLLDEVCRESDHARLDPWVVRDRPVAVGNVSELSLARQCGAQPELRSCVPVHNLAMLEAMASLAPALRGSRPSSRLRRSASWRRPRPSRSASGCSAVPGS